MTSEIHPSARGISEDEIKSPTFIQATATERSYVVQAFLCTTGFALFCAGFSMAVLTVSSVTYTSPWASAFCSDVRVAPELCLCSALPPVGHI